MKLFDLHCDTIYECCETGKHLRENDLHINYAAAHRYQPYVQFFALFCGARQPYSPETRDCLLDTPADERFDRMLTTARREFAANADWLTFCRSAADIRAAVEEGKAALVIGIGCTGGQHRSVAITKALADFIKQKGYQATENHRDMTRA